MKMKIQRKPAANLALAFLLGIIFASCCSSSDDSSDNGTDGANEDRTVGAPTGLSYEQNRSNEIKLFWTAGEKANFYQLTINNKSYTAASAYYSLTDKLPYGAEYPWQVRSGKKLTADTVYSEWATSTLSLPLTLSMKFEGLWSTDSVSVDAYMGTNPLPVDSFMPSEVDVNLLNIEIVEDERNEDNVFLSIAGLSDFLPVEEQNLNRISMASDKNTETIYGDIAIDEEHSKITHAFDPPMPLSELGIEVPPSSLIPDNIAINSLTLTFKRVAVSGKLDNAEPTKAQYEIRISAIISVNTGNPFMDTVINMYLSSSPINVTLKAYCTKMQGSN
jgi:hypothetical protein